jgi:hypothetical protein
MDLLLPAPVQKPEQQLGPAQGLSPGKGHPPAGIFIENEILFNLLHQVSPKSVQIFSIGLPTGFMGQDDPAFRIMAPVTGQGASLEKEGGPDPGTVMDTVPLDLKHIGVLTHSGLPPSPFPAPHFPIPYTRYRIVGAGQSVSTLCHGTDAFKLMAGCAPVKEPLFIKPLGRYRGKSLDNLLNGFTHGGKKGRLWIFFATDQPMKR